MTEADEAPLSERIEAALFELLADRAFHEVRLVDLAERAGVGLGALRRAYDGPFAVLSGFSRRIDAMVLDDDDPAMRAEPIKDRLFDVLMRRFDLLAPYRPGLGGLMRSARRDPFLAAHLTRLLVGSQTWILEASGVAAGGPRGAAKAAVLGAALVRLAPTFLDDEEEGLPKTMAALDEALDRLGRLSEGVARVEGVLGGLLGCRRTSRRRDRPAPAPAAEDAAIDPAI